MMLLFCFSVVKKTQIKWQGIYTVLLHLQQLQFLRMFCLSLFNCFFFCLCSLLYLPKPLSLQQCKELWSVTRETEYFLFLAANELISKADRLFRLIAELYFKGWRRICPWCMLTLVNQFVNLRVCFGAQGFREKKGF